MIPSFNEEGEEREQRNHSTKMLDHYLTEEKKTIGPNAFAIYNTLTHQATHGNKKATATTIDSNMSKVSATLKSVYWSTAIMGGA